MRDMIHKNIKENAVLRSSFMDLAKKVFGISFHSWYETGYWTGRYLPYSILDGDQVISNVSVNLMDLVWQGSAKRYVQLGTVMTHPAYRNQGLCRRLMETVLQDWKDQCDGIYLFANDSVLNFYPKFGFVRELEYQCTLPVMPEAGKFRKLSMTDQADISLLAKCYALSNPHCALPWENNFSLLMFYCGSYQKDCVYYLPDYDTVVIAEQEGTTLLCYDMFGRPEASVEQLLGVVAGPAAKQAVLGFSPKSLPRGGMLHPLPNDDALFILKNKESIFCQNQLRFPLLSHA